MSPTRVARFGTKPRHAPERRPGARATNRCGKSGPANRRATRSRIGWRILLAASILCGAADAVAAITVGPDADPTCQFHDVTSAVIAADQSPGLDLVQISSGTYTGVSTMTITSHDDLIVEGGYANCSAGISSGTSTLDAAGAVFRGSLFRHTGAGKLTLRHLVLTHGDSTAGGGVDSNGSGALTFSDVTLVDNAADYGGGLYVAGPTNPHKQVMLIGAQFLGNTARGDGGGLYALFADVTIDRARASGFTGNLANGTVGGRGDGGGAYLLNSNLRARTYSAPAGSAFIGNNLSHRFGGGLYFGATWSGVYDLNLDNDRAGEPLTIAYNGGAMGGGAYIEANSAAQIDLHARFRNTIWSDNRATYGAAVHASAIGSGAAVSTDIQFEQSRPGDDVPPCPSTLRCNRFERNIAQQGSIISAVVGGSTGHASVSFVRGSMRDNDTVSFGGLISVDGDRLDIDGSLFARNHVAGELFGVAHAALRFANSTAAYNAPRANRLFTATLAPAKLEILHSLLVQEDGGSYAAYLVGAGVPATVRDVGVLNVVLSGTNVQNLSDPFVDAAHDDFHIRTTSSATDRWAPNGDPNDPPPTLDLDGRVRPHVFNSTATPYDFGAYEAGALPVDAIFIAGFEWIR